MDVSSIQLGRDSTLADLARLAADAMFGLQHAVETHRDHLNGASPLKPLLGSISSSTEQVVDDRFFDWIRIDRCCGLVVNQFIDRIDKQTT